MSGSGRRSRVFVSLAFSDMHAEREVLRINEFVCNWSDRL